MSRDDDFRVRPGRIRSPKAQRALPFVAQALAAAQALEAQGLSAEIIDARWLDPFDWDTLADSVRKTGRLMIVHEAVLTGGFGAEIAARAGSELSAHLRAPVQRLATADCRIPAAPHLQRALIPDAGRIAAGAMTLARF